MTENTSLGIEGQRTVLDPRPADGTAGQVEQVPTAPQTDDQVLLKLKKRF